ncbi:hypothetical protein [Pseudomonas nicosulfuronedens]
MVDHEFEFRIEAVAALISLVPTVAEEIEQSISVDSTEAARIVQRQEKGWEILCAEAKQRNLHPTAFAEQVIALYQIDQGMRS